jgi:hypothetical protein
MIAIDDASTRDGDGRPGDDGIFSQSTAGQSLDGSASPRTRKNEPDVGIKRQSWRGSDARHPNSGWVLGQKAAGRVGVVGETG